MSVDSDDEDIPTLSKESMAAVLELFASKSNYYSWNYSELLKVNELEENWQLSQFWYDDETAKVLTEEVCHQIVHPSKIALIGCPSLYYFIKKKTESCDTVKLMDIDMRFAAYKEDFQIYDYKKPLPPHIPEDWKGIFDIVVLDPPFLSEECITKCALTAKFLTNKKIIVCTGAVMEHLIEQIFSAKRTTFIPKHKHNLGNEFACFINYNSDRLLFI